MFKRRHWLEVEKDADDDSSSDESDLRSGDGSDGEDDSGEDSEANESDLESEEGEEGGAAGSDSEGDSEDEGAALEKAARADKVKNQWSDLVDASDSDDEQDQSADGASGEEDSEGDEDEDGDLPFAPVKCLACPKVLLLSFETMQAHMQGKKHLARAKHMLKEGDNPLDLFMPASEVTAMGNSTEEMETHAERAARMAAIKAKDQREGANGEARPPLSERKRKKAEAGRQRQQKRLKRKRENAAKAEKAAQEGAKDQTGKGNKGKDSDKPSIRPASSNKKPKSTPSADSVGKVTPKPNAKPKATTPGKVDRRASAKRAGLKA